MKDDSYLLAGASKVDVTPPLGTRINGEFITYFAKKIHSRLYARALFLDNNKTTILFIVVDTCAMEKDFLNLIKVEIESKTGVEVNNICIASTHTHSGGSVTDLLLGGVDLPYRNKLSSLIVQSAIIAKASVKRAKLGFGKVKVPQHVLCRRYYMTDGYESRNPITGKLDVIKTNPFGDEEYIKDSAAEVDDEVGYLAVKTLDNRWISVLANYSLHYVGDFENGIISSDYFGFFADHLTELLSEDESFVPMMSNGTSGDINIWNFKNADQYPKKPFQKSKLIGQDIAKEVKKSLGNVVWDDKPYLASKTQNVELYLRKPSSLELKSSRSMIASYNFERVVLNEDSMKHIYAREQILLNELPQRSTHFLQSFKIGNGIIGTAGAELFAETGIAIKKSLPNTCYFTICLANDYVGYIPPKHELEKGGYETWRCRTSRFEENSEERIKNKLIDVNRSFLNL